MKGWPWLDHRRWSHVSWGSSTTPWQRRPCSWTPPTTNVGLVRPALQVAILLLATTRGQCTSSQVSTIDSCDSRPKTWHFVKNLLKHLPGSSQLRSFQLLISLTVAGISMCTESTMGQMSTRIGAPPCAPLTTPMPLAPIVTSQFLTTAFAIWDRWPERQIYLPTLHLLFCDSRLVNQWLVVCQGTNQIHFWATECWIPGRKEIYLLTLMLGAKTIKRRHLGEGFCSHQTVHSECDC